jgi:hypothetical protein
MLQVLGSQGARPQFLSAFVFVNHAPVVVWNMHFLGLVIFHSFFPMDPTVWPSDRPSVRLSAGPTVRPSVRPIRPSVRPIPPSDRPTVGLGPWVLGPPTESIKTNKTIPE